MTAETMMTNEYISKEQSDEFELLRHRHRVRNSLRHVQLHLAQMRLASHTEKEKLVYITELENAKEVFEKEIEELKKRVKRLEAKHTDTIPDEAMLVYEKLEEALQNKYPNKIVAIDVEMEKVVGVGNTPKEAYNDAIKKSHKTQFYFRRVGKPYLHKL